MRDALAAASPMLQEAIGTIPAAAGAVAAQLEETVELARGRAVPMHHMLAGLCKVQSCSFTFGGRDLPAAQVMAPEMFLPLVTSTAQDMAHHLLEVDLGCGLRLDDAALFGLRCVVPHITGHIVDVFRGLFFMHAANSVLGLRRNACIDLTATYEIMNEQFQALRESLRPAEGEIPWPLPQRHN